LSVHQEFMDLLLAKLSNKCIFLEDYAPMSAPPPCRLHACVTRHRIDADHGLGTIFFEIFCCDVFLIWLDHTLLSKRWLTIGRHR